MKFYVGAKVIMWKIKLFTIFLTSYDSFSNIRINQINKKVVDFKEWGLAHSFILIEEKVYEWRIVDCPGAFRKGKRY